MNREETIRMAREAGLANPLEVVHAYYELKLTDHLERFAALVAAHEREVCAKVVEDYCGAWDDEGYALAAAIRARGQA